MDFPQFINLSQDIEYYFENTNDNHNKFWAIYYCHNIPHGCKYVVRYGRIGRSTLSNVRLFSSFYDVRKAVYKRCSEKLSNGYTYIKNTYIKKYSDPDHLYGNQNIDLVEEEIEENLGKGIIDILL